MKNRTLIELNNQELLEITGGGWIKDLGKAVGDAMCAIKCAMDAAYGYFENSPAGLKSV